MVITLFSSNNKKQKISMYDVLVIVEQLIVRLNRGQSLNDSINEISWPEEIFIRAWNEDINEVNITEIEQTVESTIEYHGAWYLVLVELMRLVKTEHPYMIVDALIKLKYLIQDSRYIVYETMPNFREKAAGLLTK